MTATTTAKIAGVFELRGEGSPAFVQALAAGWEGWQEVRTWSSLERELVIDARHDGRGYVSLGVTLRQPGLDLDDTAWSARAVTPSAPASPR
jgi:hypothetical protein